MSAATTGIHHVTAICGDPQRNVDLYVGVLGLRLVKKTVNFDDPETYHLYYGDDAGNPGTIMTFFAWSDAPLGLQGTGQLTTTTFSVPEDSFSFWTQRLIDSGIRFEKPESRFGETILSFADPDGMRVEITASPDETREPWPSATVPAEHAIRGFHHVTLAERDPEQTANLMTEHLGFRLVKEADGRSRFEAGDGGPGNFVDVLDGSGNPRGRMGVATVHHVAFRATDDEHQGEIRDAVDALGYNVTPVIDRNYFNAIYFREPGGVLFEIATDPPGFAADEDPAELGTNLKLPPQYEPRREELQRVLPPLRLPGVSA